MSTASTEDVGRRLALVRDRIVAAGGDPGRVRVVAVTKSFGIDAVRAALAAGVVDLGENYADELVGKAGELARSPAAAAPAWHFIGSIQRNKIGRLAPHVALFEGVDRLEEGATIARRRPGAAVLIEVAAEGSNPDGSARGGVAAAEVDRLAAGLARLGLEVRGLMTVAPQGDAAGARRAFSTVAGLVARLGLEEASMGMTDDLELAVAEGSTMVRVGRALFGARTARRGCPSPGRAAVAE